MGWVRGVNRLCYLSTHLPTYLPTYPPTYPLTSICLLDVFLGERNQGLDDINPMHVPPRLHQTAHGRSQIA